MRIGAIAHSGKPLTAVKAAPAGADGGMVTAQTVPTTTERAQGICNNLRQLGRSRSSWLSEGTWIASRSPIVLVRHSNDTRAHLGYRWFNQGTGLRPINPVSDTHHSVASESRNLRRACLAEARAGWARGHRDRRRRVEPKLREATGERQQGRRGGGAGNSTRSIECDQRRRGDASGRRGDERRA